jgi:hypothetical protein
MDTESSSGNRCWTFRARGGSTSGRIKAAVGRNFHIGTFTRSHPSAMRSSLPPRDQGMAGWGPVRWQFFQRNANGESFRSCSIGISHWLVLVVLMTMTWCRFGTMRATRRDRHTTAGLMPGAQGDVSHDSENSTWVMLLPAGTKWL